MTITYDTLGSTVSIHPVGAVPPSGLNTSVAIIGGYDSDNADSSVTEGETTTVTSGTNAETMFGADCELTYQAKLAFTNGATQVYGIPLPETETTETFGSGSAVSSGTLAEPPAMDPRYHPDHEITAQDVTNGESMTVNIVDTDSPSQPSDADTMNLHPDSGSFEADETSEYEITYTYGDFSTALDEAVQEPVRYIGVCTENDSVIGDAQTKLTTRAADFYLNRAVVNADAQIESGDISSYTTAVEDWRVVEVAPTRGTSPSGTVRTVGAVLGLLAQQPIDVSGSITYDTVAGLESLAMEYTPTTAESFSQVTAITENFEIAGGYTTSSETAFQDIYKVEIIDFVVEQLHARVKNYSGGSNSSSAQRRFSSRLKRALASMSAPASQPPLLATADGSQAYSVSVTPGSTNTETDVDIGIQVAPIAKEVNLDISTGPFQFGGASV